MNSSLNSHLTLNLFGMTDVGQVRGHNEDNFLMSDLKSASLIPAGSPSFSVEPEGLLLCVCDGMGGAAAGEVASQLAVDIIAEQLNAGTASNRDELARNMVGAIEFAGNHIFQEARADRSRRGMGTTSTVAVLADSRIYFGQVGDSRAYLLRDNELRLLTRDQSLVNQLIEAGQLTEEEAETFEHNNIILQALGTSETVQVDLTYADLQLGDQVIICSDGLSGMIRDREIQKILSATTSPEQACAELIQSANASGGHDNITVIVAKVLKGPEKHEATFGYQKYTLPPPPVVDVEAFADTGDYPAPDFSQALESARPSAEAAAETRQLRVSHTVAGMSIPKELRAQLDSKRTEPEAPIYKEDENGSSMIEAPKENRQNSTFLKDEEPVSLPTKRLSLLVRSFFLIAMVALAGLILFLSVD